MTAPHAILLVPTGAGAALLADGVCGSLPPVVSRWPDGTSLAGMRLDTWAVEPARHAHGPRTRAVFALPLWWDGAPVRDGVFRAWDAWGPDEDAAELWATGWTTYDVLTEAMDATGGAEWLARSLERQGLCRVVLLDLVDGRLVERAP